MKALRTKRIEEYKAKCPLGGRWYLRPDRHKAGLRLINEWEGSEDVVEELAERPWALDKSREVVRDARTELGADLPETEVNFLALHLAAIAEVQGKVPGERRSTH